MIDFFLSILGLGQSGMQRAEERKLHAAAILARVDTIAKEAALRLDYEILRLRVEADAAAISPSMVVASLVTMRKQCDELQEMVERSRDLLNKKGANSSVIFELEKWLGTCSVIPQQIELGVRQIELAIANGVGSTLR